MGMQVRTEEVASTVVRDGRDACVRLLAVRRGERWVLHSCWALVGAEPPGWAESVWMYERLAFVAARMTAVDLASLLSVDSCPSVTVGPLTVWAPGAQSTASMERRPAYSRFDRPQLSFPVAEYKISPTESYNGQLLPTPVANGMLVGDGGAPSFPDSAWAWQAFFEGDFSLTGSRGVATDLAVVRIAEQGARLGAVHVTATELKVSVEGDDVRGSVLELYGVEGRRVERLDGPGQVIIPLPRGLPAHAWLWLKRGTAWLDYRSLDLTSAWTDDLQRAGVEFDTPVDPVTVVEALIASGEGLLVEFKEMLPASTKDRRTLKTIAAFANGDGGTIVFGVDRDEVTIVGLTGTEPSTKMRDDLANLVRGAVQPTPVFDVREYRLDGRLLLVLEVQPGDQGPYGLVMPGQRDKQTEYFVRRGANTYPAQPGDLRAIVLRNGGTSIGGANGRYAGMGWRG